MEIKYLSNLKRADFEINVEKTVIFKGIETHITFDGSVFNYIIDELNIKGSCESLQDLKSEISDRIYDAK